MTNQLTTDEPTLILKASLHRASNDSSLLFTDFPAVTEMWNVIQLQKQTEANRDGINKLMEITSDILARLAGLDLISDQMEG